MKKIIIDFETTHRNPSRAYILEFCALFVENNHILEEYYEFVKFDKKWDECSEIEKDTLRFNKIYSDEDIQKHNMRAKSEKEVIDAFISKVDMFELGLPISGWSNGAYDGVILINAMERCGYFFLDYFDYYHPRDVMCRFQPIWEKFYKDEFGLHLKMAHQYLFADKIKDDKFHSANYDCYATLDMDMWVERFYSEIENDKKVKIENNV